MSQKIKTETSETSEELRRKKIKQSGALRHQSAFETYGVKIGLKINSKKFSDDLCRRLDEIFPEGRKAIDFSEARHIFYVNATRTAENNFVDKNDEPLLDKRIFKPEDLEPHLRLTVAEFAENCIFLHAGAVTYGNLGIIIPGKSFAGKSTLVAELAKRGFRYFSDEYAVIDFDGKLHPYAKKVSLRGIVDDYTQVDVAVEELGGRKGRKPVKIGLILVTTYKKNAKFKLKKLTAGEGIIEAVANSVSIRRNPSEVLNALTKVVKTAEIVKTNRGEVAHFADKLIEYLSEKF